MDSLTHLALGAAVGVAAMGRRTALWKSASWGAVACTLPDLDVLIAHGDPILDMVLHRAHSHAPFWLTLASLPLGAAVARLHGEWALWRRWWLAVWLALLVHPLLDAMTVYGTQVALPWSSQPVGLGSIFIIDPLYTLPLVVGVVWALAAQGRGRSLAANAAGLLLSSAYLAWGAAAQAHVEHLARESLAAQGLASERLLVTPTAFNSLLWRVVSVAGGEFHEGFYSLLDAKPRIAFDRFERGTALLPAVAGIADVQRLVTFTKGFYKLQQDGDDTVLISDLRMGQEPFYIFTFAVAQGRGAATMPLVPPRKIAARLDWQRGLPWLWRRMLGQALPPPR